MYNILFIATTITANILPTIPFSRPTSTPGGWQRVNEHVEGEMNVISLEWQTLRKQFWGLRNKTHARTWHAGKCLGVRISQLGSPGIHYYKDDSTHSRQNKLLNDWFVGWLIFVCQTSRCPKWKSRMLIQFINTQCCTLVTRFLSKKETNSRQPTVPKHVV